MSDDAEFPENNGVVLNIAEMMCNVVMSAVDAKINALFINTRHAIPARYLLNKMGHTQPATPAQTDNITALGFVTKNSTPKPPNQLTYTTGTCTISRAKNNIRMRSYIGLSYNDASQA